MGIETIDLRRRGTANTEMLMIPQVAAQAWFCAQMLWAMRLIMQSRNPAHPVRWYTYRHVENGLIKKWHRLDKLPGLIMLCGRPEGVDQRVLDHYNIQEVSLGDFVMTGGELAAQAMIDATVRLLPDVLGNADSTVDESHSNGLLEHPQYTRPAEWMGLEIPEVLTSGNHAKVAEWRKAQSEILTQQRRPDLWEKRVKEAE